MLHTQGQPYYSWCTVIVPNARNVECLKSIPYYIFCTLDVQYTEYFIPESFHCFSKVIIVRYISLYPVSHVLSAKCTMIVCNLIIALPISSRYVYMCLR